jgi:hypothetical protein
MHQGCLLFRGPGWVIGSSVKKDGDSQKREPRFATFSPLSHPILAALMHGFMRPERAKLWLCVG